MQLKFMMRVHFQRDFTEQLVKLVSLLRARQQMQAVRDRFRSIHATKRRVVRFPEFQILFLTIVEQAVYTSESRHNWVSSMFSCFNSLSWREHWLKCFSFLRAVFILLITKHCLLVKNRFPYALLLTGFGPCEVLWTLQNVPTSSFTSLKA